MTGSPRTFAAFAATLVWLACAAASASAQLQLPDLTEPLPDQPVRQVVEPVQDIVEQPLPSPVEEVVEQSPVAPIREQVRDTVRDVTGGAEDVVDEVVPPIGGGGGGGGSTGSASGSGPANTAATPGSNAQGGDPGSAEGGRGGSGQARGGGSAADRAGGGGSGSGDAGSAAGGAASGPDAAGGVGDAASAQGGDDDQGPLARTVERIVEVVPWFVWVALGALALVALALGARAFVDRRRARSLERERERLLHDMSLLERVLLPQVPERLGDLATSVAYRPAAGPAAGGDFYDVFELSEGRVALLVGDVSGHGREALEGTGALLRPTLRSQLEAGVPPRIAIEAAGRAAGIAADGRFTTVVAAVHDPAAGTLTYATAGHPPPVLVGPGAHEPLVAVSSPPLGVGIRTGVRQTTVPLPRGATACFFTDGLLEARSGGELLGHEWLAGMVAELGPLGSASEVLDRVVEEADEAPDDMTACVVRAVAGPQSPAARIEELELDADELASSAPGRFLEACEVPEETVATVLAEAERAIAETGRALLTVTIDAAGPSVGVTGRKPEALATT